MNYLKKLYPILLIALAGSVVFYVLAYFGVFNITAFVVLPVLVGFTLGLVQNESISYKFLDKLLIGSLILGILSSFSLGISTFFVNLNSPQFYLNNTPFFNLKDQLTMAGVLAFVSFLGGLAGIVIKGFFSLLNKDKTDTEFNLKNQNKNKITIWVSVLVILISIGIVGVSRAVKQNLKNTSPIDAQNQSVEHTSSKNQDKNDEQGYKLKKLDISKELEIGNSIISIQAMPGSSPSRDLTLDKTTVNGKTKLTLGVIMVNNIPELYLTSNPDVLYMKVSEADLGGGFEQWHLIDIKNQDVVSMEIPFDGQGPFEASITNRQGNKSKIAINFSDFCQACNSKKTSVNTDGLLVNGNNVTLKKDYSLMCANPCELGNVYDPQPVFDFLGIDNDLNKIYFSVTGQENGRRQIWQEKFSFDLSTQKTTREEPNDLLALVYRDDQENFEFTYPMSWNLYEALDSFSTPFVGEGVNFGVGVIGNPNNLQPKEWVDKNNFFRLPENPDEETFIAYGVDKGQVKTNSNGVPSIVYSGGAEGGGSFGVVVFSLNNKVGVISYALRPDFGGDFQAEKEETQQMLADVANSIKVKTVDTSNWHTHRNQKQEYEFKYPKDWLLNFKDGDAILNEKDKEYSIEGSPVDYLVKISRQELPTTELEFSLEEYAKTQLGYKYDGTLTKMKFGQADGVRVRNYLVTQTFVAVNGWLYEIYAPNVGEWEVLRITDAIADSFKLIEPLTTTNWQTYVNTDLGVEFKYPYQTLPYSLYYEGNYVKCQGNDQEKNVLVPLTVLDSENELFLAEEYYYNDKCQVAENSFDFMKEQSPDRGAWHMFVKKVNNEAELLKLIQQRYGSGCGIKELKETEYPDTYDVLILGDGKDLGETSCPVNYITFIKYSPDKQLVAYWDIGQECTKNSSLDYSNNKCFDYKIADMFRFVDECTAGPVTLDIGRDVYPISEEYRNLHFLGQLFTASDCKDSRVSQIWGVSNNTYGLGAHIYFKENLSDELAGLLRDTGFKPDEECSGQSDNVCREWFLWEAVSVDKLLKLKPYASQISNDDCVNCG